MFVLLIKARVRREDKEPGEAGVVIPQPSLQRVNLDQSWMFRGTVALKSEKIIYCPIQKVRHSYYGIVQHSDGLFAP